MIQTTEMKITAPSVQITVISSGWVTNQKKFIWRCLVYQYNLFQIKIQNVYYLKTIEGILSCVIEIMLYYVERFCLIIYGALLMTKHPSYSCELSKSGCWHSPLSDSAYDLQWWSLSSGVRYNSPSCSLDTVLFKD